MAVSLHRAAAFGLHWLSDLPLTPFEPAPPGAGDVTILRTDHLADRPSPRPLNNGQIHPDGFRLHWGQEAVFDMFDGARITYLPGPEWTGAFPSSLFGTVAALTLAWRGALPFHACAVELDGEAFLIAGPSGSGKSGLTAGLIGVGARFVCDDLSVLQAGAGLTISPGRSTMRLDPALVDSIDAVDRAPAPGDARGKWLVRPRARTALGEMPVAGLLLLASAGRPIQPLERLAVLTSELFRPRWLAALPNHRERLARILEHGRGLPIARFPSIGEATVTDPSQRARDALTVLAGMRRP